MQVEDIFDFNAYKEEIDGRRNLKNQVVEDFNMQPSEVSGRVYLSGNEKQQNAAEPDQEGKAHQ